MVTASVGRGILMIHPLYETARGMRESWRVIVRVR